MVSSTLSVEVFLYTIEQFFRARDALGGIEVDAEVFNSLLEVIMTIKFDRLLLKCSMDLLNRRFYRFH